MRALTVTPGRPELSSPGWLDDMISRTADVAGFADLLEVGEDDITTVLLLDSPPQA